MLKNQQLWVKKFKNLSVARLNELDAALNLGDKAGGDAAA